MFEQINALPGSQSQPSPVDRYGEVSLGESGAYVRGHVVRAFGGVPVKLGLLGHQPGEEIIQIGGYVRVGVLLNQQGRGSMLAKKVQQPGLDMLCADPGLDLAREIIQAFAVRSNLDLMRELSHSTVTLLARLRG